MPSSALFLDLLALSAFPTRRSSDLIARSGPVHRGAALRPGPVPDKTKKAHLSMRLFLETIPVMQRPCPGQGQHRTPASVDSVLQRLARLEARDAGSGDLNGLSSLGIAAHARCPLLDRKAAKAYEGDLAATFQGLGKRFDRSAEHTSELQSRGHLV